jgi:hypothetical protein
MKRHLITSIRMFRCIGSRRGVEVRLYLGCSAREDVDLTWGNFQCRDCGMSRSSSMNEIGER